jgi:hypothetical protein
MEKEISSMNSNAKSLQKYFLNVQPSSINLRMQASEIALDIIKIY